MYPNRVFRPEKNTGIYYNLRMLILNAILLFLGLTASSFAYEQMEPRPIQDTVGSSFGLPFFVSASGDVSLLKNTFSDGFSFSPFINAGGAFRSAHYVLPERTKSFSLGQKSFKPRWLEVHTREISAGLGLQAIAKSTIKLGLVPFKGAKQRLVKQSDSDKLSKVGINLLPKSLKQIESWSVGDRGTFEVFGGIEVLGSTAFSVLEVSATLLVQNSFILEISRISQDEVSLALIEKSDRNRSLSAGLTIAQASVSKIKGKTLGAEFVLDLTMAEHHDLYLEALNGNLAGLQNKLPHSSQKTSWSGLVRTATLGLPVLAAKSFRSGRVEINEKNTETVLVFKSKKSKGMILPHRDVHRMLYFSPRQMVLFWSAEQMKVKGSLLEKRFLKIGRRIGIEGFEFEVDPQMKIGSAMTQLGVTLTQVEFSKMANLDIKLLDSHFYERCEDLKLNCRSDKRRAKILAELMRLVKKPWKEGREAMGILLAKNPSLINSVVKTLKLSKKGYFYLLSDTVQSMEGMGLIKE